MENKKLRRLLLLLLLLLLLGYGIYTIFFRKDRSTLPNDESGSQSTENIEDDDSQDGTLTPEEVIKQLEGDSTLEGDIQMTIISPEGKTFLPGQARLWRAQLENIENDASFGVNCHWKFYLNENNEEILYKEMENRSGVSKEDPNVCGFTSTFIDRVGLLRVVLDAEVVTSAGDIIESYTAQREYTVK